MSDEEYVRLLDDADISADEVMRRYPKMWICVGILIEACKNSAEGHKALAKWDRCRGA